MNPTPNAAASALFDDADGPRPSELVDGRYRVIEQIGRGGMGSVYRAEHIGLGRMFAIKLLRREFCEEEGMVRRFQRESRMAASIESEHVVSIVDSGTLADQRPYFVMELLLGNNLRAELAAQKSLPPVRAVNIALDVCQGLQRAHALGLVHRDLKPENLFLTRGDDGREVVKILDFGVAKSNDTITTRPGALVGTIRYMAPEQVGLDVPLGPATDTYALGVILYECLSGISPFSADTVERTLYRVMTATVPPLRDHVSTLPEGLALAVERAIQRDPAQRYPSARAFAEALLPFAGTRGAKTARGAAMGTADTTQVLELEKPLAAVGASTANPAHNQPTRAPSWFTVGVATLGSATLTAGLVWTLRSPPQGSVSTATTSTPQTSSAVIAPVAAAASAPAPQTSSADVVPDVLPPPTVSNRPAIALPPLARKAKLPFSAASAQPKAPTNPAVFDPQNPYEP